jgi:xanthine dehydrogenase iron-sulfur cluster and FAD-binding subunit A
LQGNLCRCTGYAPIIRAGEAMGTYGQPPDDVLWAERIAVKDTVKAFNDGRRVVVGEGDKQIIIPASLDDFATVYEANPEARIVAGSTDVGLWVTKFMRNIGPVIFIGHLQELRRILRRRFLFRGAADHSGEFPAARGALEPHCRRADPQYGDHRREYRQWVADWRYAAAVHCAGRKTRPAAR